MLKIITDSPRSRKGTKKQVGKKVSFGRLFISTVKTLYSPRQEEQVVDCRIINRITNKIISYVYCLKVTFLYSVQ